MKQICQEILKKHKYEAESITYLKSGANSTIYKCLTNKGNIIVKIKLNSNSSLENEFKVLKLIEKQKIAPKVHHHGIIQDKPYLIEDFIEGKRLPWRGMKEEDVLLVADFFNKLHSIKIEKKLKTKKFQPIDRLEYPRNFINKNKEFKELFKIIENKLKGLKFKDSQVLRHTDPNPHNFIKTKNKIISVDFEESRIGPYLTDIADFFVKANLNEKKQKLFYKRYKEKNIEKEVNAYVIISILGLAAWKLNRLDLIKKGKLHKKNYKSLTEEEKSVQRLINKLKKILK